jgi:hypothetical protein
LSSSSAAVLKKEVQGMKWELKIVMGGEEMGEKRGGSFFWDGVLGRPHHEFPTYIFPIPLSLTDLTDGGY